MGIPSKINRFHTFCRTGMVLLLMGATFVGVAAAQPASSIPSSGLQFFPVVPCRVVDTQNPNGLFGGPPIQGGTSRSFPIPQNSDCNIPSNAAAYAFTVTVIPTGQLGLLTAYPTGENRGAVVTMVSRDGRVKSDAAIVPAGTNAAVSVYASDTTNVVLDIAGYFGAASQNSLEFYPLTPCRLVDTRGGNGPLGGPYLQAGLERDFPLLLSPCVPGLNPLAYSLNFTVVPRGGGPLNYLTAWPEGAQRPITVTLTDPTGTIVGDASIVAAGPGGAIAVYPSNDTDLVIDINGYFGPPGAGGLSLYSTSQPCHAFTSQRSVFDPGFSGMIVVPVGVPGNPCGLPGTAQAYVFNATVYPQGRLGFLTLWANGQQQPVVGNLEAIDGSIVSNMAIVPTTNGYIDAYASSTTQLSLDIMSYFAP